ncbi:MAG: MBL fold metallo-hydrolase [Lachnospiraceae bacterium]
MKIQVLVDNYTYIDQYYVGEPGVSYYIEMDGNRILFDTGYSNIYLQNAEAMGIDLPNLTHIVLSHGHNDHSRGLKYLGKYMELSHLELIAHPDCFLPKENGGIDISAPYTIEEISAQMEYIPRRKPYALSENCIFLGEIPRKNDIEPRCAMGKQKEEQGWVEDYLMDDSALVLRTEEGLFIVTGCSHSGICNIVNYAMEICKEKRIVGILGGFHLLEANERVEKTIQYLQQVSVEQLYPCHCVSLEVKAKMMERLNVAEVGVGLVIER